MSERTARTDEHAGKRPSEGKRPQDWQTRPHPWEEDWPWVVEQLERDPAIPSTTLFALVCERHPDRSRPTQDRTLRRHLARGKAWPGPENEGICEQIQTPGERAPSDFSPLEDVGVTIGGEPFPQLVSHVVRTSSNVETARGCFSETCKA